MAPAGGVDKQVYSQFTLGALQDSGWYLPRWGGEGKGVCRGGTVSSRTLGAQQDSGWYLLRYGTGLCPCLCP